MLFMSKNILNLNNNQPSIPDDQSAAWLRIKQVQNVYGLSRGKVFQMIKSGQVVSASLCNMGTSRGVRLIARKSLDNLLLASIDNRVESGCE